MQFAGPLLETVKGLWGLASKPVGYIYNLKDNVRLLDEKNKTLKSMSGDEKTKVECEEVEAHVGPTKQVEDWLGRVQNFFGEVDQILREAKERDEIKCLSRWLPRNCWSSYKLGKRVDQLLNEVRQLQNEREKFIDLTSPLLPPPVLKKPMDKPVGLDISLNKVLKWLVDEKQVGVIGLYGVGGVGKTTLVKRINEELSHANYEFDVVIWVVVSRQVNEDSIQDAIRKRLNIKDESWRGWSQDERINYLWEVLSHKKFVLLIDDVWERLDLSKIGVPRPSFENGSKVVFTTRSKQVCHQMQADKILEVQCLKFEEALELFENNVGKSTIHSHPEILELAKDIVRECKGLPFALIIVARAMASRKKPSEWNDALRTLRNNPYKLSGMVEKVYHILEFSYNNLVDSTSQLCFLYCCLFPKDYHIVSRDLIELWIGEGLLGDTNDVYNMREKGDYILENLKMACLLESGCDDNEEEYVKMHDVIRDMAIWIARDHGQRENKLLVIEKEEDLSAEMISKWGEAEKVSIWGEWIQNIDQALPRCFQLKTLIVRKTNVMEVPRGFFESMTACLTVLDLSDNNNIDSFPEGICNMISLRYLNLSNTLINEMPKEIKNLTRLRCLLLNNIKGSLIFRGAIASLPLNVFSNWNLYLEKEEEVVEELGRMQGLTDLSIDVLKSSSALKIFQSFQRCIRRASIMGCEDLTSISISHSLEGSGNFSHLEVLRLLYCPMLWKMEITQGPRQAPNHCFPSLIEVYVFNCGFLDLSWLVHAPRLQELTVIGCLLMEKIIGDGIAREKLVASRLFSRLKFLHIEDLPKLMSICDHALLFPQGVKFIIEQCPCLKKLPLDSNSARGSFSINGDKGWWDEFKWDPAARVTFQLSGLGPALAMTFGEAARKVKDGYFRITQIEFLPHEPSK